MPVEYDLNGFFQTDMVTASTSGGGANTVFTFTPTIDTALHVYVHAIGIQTNGVAEVSGYIVAGAYRNNNGAVGEIGVTSIHAQEDVGGWGVTTVVDGSNVLVQVTGAAGDDINWRVIIQSMTVAI